MPRWRTIRAVLGTVLGVGVGVGCAALSPLPARAAILVGCTEAELVTAIDTANATAEDSLTLTPGCTYTLTAAHGGTDTGLPVITSGIDLTGPATITRSTAISTPLFRIAEVGPAGALTLDSVVTLSGGEVSGYGGGILNSGTVTLNGSEVLNNIAGLGGGGLANLNVPPGSPATVTMTGGQVSNNMSARRGGGIFNGPGSTLTATGVSIIGNFARGRGGGVAAIRSTATTLTGVTVTGNAAYLNGGGVFRNAGTMVVSASTITTNLQNNCTGPTLVPTCVD
jgi:hypothetical protein